MSIKKILVAVSILTATTIIFSDEPSCGNRFKTHGATRFSRFFADVAYDAAITYKNIFTSWSTYKTFVATAPVYAAARMADHDIHSWFYDYKTGKNINSMGHRWHMLAETWVIRGIAGFSLGGFFFADDVKLRETCYSFLIGLPLVILSSNIIKAFAKGEYCLRPYHEKFATKKRVIGGFPSTHAAQVAFATTIFGMQEGIPAIVPLGFLSTYVLIAFLNDSRHYLSQLVGGVGLGVVHGIASSKLADSKIIKKLDMGLAFDKCGNPALKVGFNF